MRAIPLKKLSKCLRFEGEVPILRHLVEFEKVMLRLIFDGFSFECFVGR